MCAHREIPRNEIHFTGGKKLNYLNIGNYWVRERKKKAKPSITKV